MVNAFSLLHIKERKNIEALWIVFQPSLLIVDQKAAQTRYLNALSRIIASFFVIKRNIIDEQYTEDDNNNVVDNASDPPKTTSAQSRFSIDQLYFELQQAHVAYDKFNTKKSDIFHPDLNAVLAEYQIEAVRWMLQREKFPDYFPTEFVEIRRRWPVQNDKHRFYYNERTTELKMTKENVIELPTGGILADEMGLGKTVEILALILLNQRDLECLDKNNNNTPKNVKRARLDFSENLLETKIKCVCMNDDTSYLIQCTKCFRSQHKHCVMRLSTGATTEENYICPDCWRHEPKISSSATFIVSPANIKMQWYHEVKKHIGNNRLKVLVYKGFATTGWISPVDLATYDIVLTDYNTMQTELYYSEACKPTRTLRKPPRRINPVSPLHFVEWWRVCLDEAQMVESVDTHCAQMVHQLPACHRWAVTGTPIQRSVNDLYGLFYFLNCKPYSESSKWDELRKEFSSNGNLVGVVAVLKKIMWRTSKNAQILSDIKVPPQTEIIHYVELSDSEKLFYNNTRAESLTEFQENAQRIGGKVSVATMSHQMLKLVCQFVCLYCF